MREDIRPGGTFPDYSLPDHLGTVRRLSDLQGPDPMVLTLHRGAFCPKDRIQLLSLSAFQDECVVGYTRLVSITSDDDLLSLNELRQGVKAHWPFLLDCKRRIADDLGIHEYTDQRHRPMIPFSFVLAPGLKIHSLYNGYHYWGRPTREELYRDLRAVSRDVRPDWVIDTDEMRARWDRGDKDDFYPYGQDKEEVLARMAGAVDRFAPGRSGE